MPIIHFPCTRWIGGLGVVLLLAGCTDEADRNGATSSFTINPATVAQADDSIDLITAEVDSEEIEPTAAGSYLSALVAANDRDMGSAADYFLMTLQTDHDNPELLRQAHLALVMDGRVAEAVPIAERMEVLAPDDAIAALTLAVHAVKEGDADDALARIGQLQLQGYNTLIVPLAEAWVEVGRGQTEAALEAIAAGLNDDGFEVFRAYHIALIEDLAGDVEAADRAYRLALESQEGGAYRVVRAYGDFLRRQGRDDDARAIYENFTTINPNTNWLEDALVEFEAGTVPDHEIDTPAKGLAEVMFGIASAVDSSSSGGPALVYGQLASYLDPSSDVIHLLIGDLLEIEGRPLEAVEAYQLVNPDSSLARSARLRTAVNLDRAGQSEEAIAILRELADQDPDRSDALVTLGDILRVQQRWDEAVETYDQAVDQLGPVAYDDWRLLYVRGIALERAGDWPRAEADFLAALEVNPESPYVLNYLGYTWVDLGLNLDKALDMIERAVEQRPQDGYIVDSLGWALYRLDDFDGAVRYLERAVELEPGDPVINDHLGDAYWQVGRRTEAQFQWKRAMSLAEEGDEELTVPIQAKLDGGLDAGG